MKINISAAGLEARSHGSLSWIGAADDQIRIFSPDLPDSWLGFFDSLARAEDELDLAGGALTRALHAEGYQYNGDRIALIRLRGMQGSGQIVAQDMKPEYFDLVRDWQIKTAGCEWIDGGAEDLNCGEFATVWRPKSYAIEEVVEDMKDRIKTDVETRLSNACAPSQPIATTSGTRLNIARAGIRKDAVLVDHIEITDKGLWYHRKRDSRGPFSSVHAMGDEDAFYQAIHAEGYQLRADGNGFEFRPGLLPKQDSAGQIKAEDMKPSYLQYTRDWQKGTLGGDWIDSRDLDCGATGTLWRPKSRSVEIGDGLLNPWAESTISVAGCAGPELTAEAARAAISETFTVLTRDEQGRLETVSIGYQVEPTETISIPPWRSMSEHIALPKNKPTDVWPTPVERTSSGGILDQPPADERVFPSDGAPLDWLGASPQIEPDPDYLDQIRSIEPDRPDHVHAFDSECMACKVCGRSTEDVYAEHVRTHRDPTVVSAYERIALSMAALVEDKQRQYGDSVGKTGALLAILYPDGIQPDQYDRALLVVRMLDKLSRLATNKTDLGGESPFRDIMGYAMLAVEKGI